MRYLMALAISCLAMPAFSSDYTILDLGIHTVAGSSGTLNNAQTASGFWIHEPQNGAFSWSAGTAVSLQNLYSNDSQPYDINENNVIVGSSTGPQPGFQRGMIWTNGMATEVPTFGGRESYAFGINNSGVVVGRADFFQANTNIMRGFVWESGSMTQLSRLPGALDSIARSINDQGDVVGWSNHSSGFKRAVRWVNLTIQNLGVLSGFDASEALDVNNGGQVLIRNTRTGVNEKGAIWQNGSLTELSGPLGTEFKVSKINNAGQVIGGFHDGSFNGEALFSPGEGYFLPHTLFHESDGWTEGFCDLLDVNDNGQMLALARQSSSGQYRYVIISPETVPEGSTMVSLVAGTVLLYSRSRLRQ